MNDPQWRDRPTVPGLWVWMLWGRKPCVWKFSQQDVDKYENDGMVYGPIPELPKEK